MTTTSEVTLEPVRNTVTVKATPERAFRIFTEGVDTWWPREHHIGKAPMTRTIIEPRQGGRCYTEHTDGSEQDFATVIAWEPPHRFAMAWLINGYWQYDPDVAHASEVEIRFSDAGDGQTRVDLEHRHFERMTVGAAEMHAAVMRPNAWNGLLRKFAEKAEEA